MYSRLINAPTSIVGHDDYIAIGRSRKGLAAHGNEWVSLHRNFTAAEAEDIAGKYGANNEVPMRGQFRAWLKFMTCDMNEGGRMS